MKVVIINKNENLGVNIKLTNKIENCFCGRYAPYIINSGSDIKEGRHVGLLLLGEKNPELINKIINLIKNESRKNLG